MSIESDRQELERELKTWTHLLEQADDEAYRQYCRLSIESIRKSLRELEEAGCAYAN